MIFRQIDEIISGYKTQTRRIKKENEYFLPVADRPERAFYNTVFYTIEKRGFIRGDFYAEPEERIRIVEHVKWEVGKDYAVQPGHGKPGVLWRQLGSQYQWSLPDKRIDVAHGWTPLRIRILDIHEEKLQDISEEDAIAEGMEGDLATWHEAAGTLPTPREQYAIVWDEINTRPSTRWADNPEVWVISFELVK